MLPTPLILALALVGQAPDAAPAPAPAASPAPQPLAEPDRLAPEFVAVLGKAQATYAGLKTFSVTARIRSTLTPVGGEAGPAGGSTSTQTIVASRPGRFAVSCDWAEFGAAQEQPALRVACDGKRLVTYYVPDGLYAEYEGPDPAVQVYRQRIVESTLDASGLSVTARPDMRDHVLRHARSAAVEGREEVGGVPTVKYRVDYDGVPVVMWLGPDEAPLLRRLEATLETAAADALKFVTTRRSDLTWTLDAEVPDSAFALEVPATAKRVDDVYEALTEAATPPVVDAPAPALKLKDLDGAEVAIAPAGGKPTVLVFWATWAAESGEVIKQAASLQETLGDRARVLVVCLGDEAGPVRRRTEGVAGLPTLLLDPDDEAAAAFGVKDVPSAVVIAADGKVAYDAPGLDIGAVDAKVGGR